MTASSGSPYPPPPPPEPERGGSVALTAIVLLALGAGAVFWAGLTLGNATTGRDAQEQSAIEAFTQAYRDIADDYIGSPVPQEVLEGALGGMVDALGDPYSDYMSPDEFDAALNDAYGEFEGIGVEVDTTDAEGAACTELQGEGCRLLIVRVLSDAPAEAAGLLVGDMITAVDGRGPGIDTENAGSGGQELEVSESVEDMLSRIRGRRGTDVTLTIERDGVAQDFTVTRDTVAFDDVFGATLADGRVGYIAVDNFSGNAAADFEDELESHLEAGIDKLVVDVRDDPGGFVDATVEISSQFIEDGPVFWEEYADGSLISVDVTGEGIGTDAELDVALLVNGSSASASEILGGALQDSGRALLVGQPTFGKGSVQEWNELPGENGGMRLSVARWLTRDKHSIDAVGLTPDHVVELEGRRYRADDPSSDPSTDFQLQTAIALLLDEPLPTATPVPSPSAGASIEPAT